MKMSDPKMMERLQDFEKRMSALRKEMRETLAEAAVCDVEDYTFQSTDGPVKLSDLFRGKRDLFVVHNMGKSCSYCTLWADGFNGAYQHLANRAGFVISSPDKPEVQKEFAASRGWQFPMVSIQGTTFATDLGFDAGDHVLPGVSVFQMDGGKIRRVNMTIFGPHDDYCAVWHFLSLIPEGANGWEPKYQYA